MTSTSRAPPPPPLPIPTSCRCWCGVRAPGCSAGTVVGGRPGDAASPGPLRATHRQKAQPIERDPAAGQGRGFPVRASTAHLPRIFGGDETCKHGCDFWSAARGVAWERPRRIGHCHLCCRWHFAPRNAHLRTDRNSFAAAARCQESLAPLHRRCCCSSSDEPRER